MSYLVLARKWRPQTFHDLVGQDHVRRTLENAIAQNRVAHAFLFTGVRGVGKTTSARLLAKALNCEKGPTATPCQVCAQCVDITSGADIDVRELDGASNNGVDEVRKLQEELPYRPTRDRFKIYIVDEVHMLSSGAWNAFLKTLEEPPPHVKFIFATTEVHKVPITILSRCQRYDFKMISVQTIAQRLRFVLQQEKISADDSAVNLLAREAAGSMRDAMSLLDQAIAWAGERLVGDEVARVLGVASHAVLHQLAVALVGGQGDAALRIVAQLVENGYDLLQVARDLLAVLRDLVVARVCTDPGHLLDLSEDERAATVALANRTSVDDLVRLHQGFARAFDDVARSPAPRASLEMALVRLARRPPLVPLDDLLERLTSLERRLNGGPEPGGAGPGHPAGSSGRSAGKGAGQASAAPHAPSASSSPSAHAAPVVSSASHPPVVSQAQIIGATALAASPAPWSAPATAATPAPSPAPALAPAPTPAPVPAPAPAQAPAPAPVRSVFAAMQGAGLKPAPAPAPAAARPTTSPAAPAPPTTPPEPASAPPSPAPASAPPALRVIPGASTPAPASSASQPRPFLVPQQPASRPTPAQPPPQQPPQQAQGQPATRPAPQQAPQQAAPQAQRPQASQQQPQGQRPSFAQPPSQQRPPASQPPASQRPPASQQPGSQQPPSSQRPSFAPRPFPTNFGPTSQRPAEPPPSSSQAPSARPRMQAGAMAHDPDKPMPEPHPGVDFARWREVVEQVRKTTPALASVLERASPFRLGNDGLTLLFSPNSFEAARVAEPKYAEPLDRIIRATLGPEAKVTVELRESAADDLTLAKLFAKELWERREAARKRVREHPLVKAAIEELGAELKDVRVSEDERR